MRQGTLTMFFSAVIALLLLSGLQGEVFAGEKNSGKLTAKRGESYAAAYETVRVKRYSDIIPDDSDNENRAGSVNNGSVKVKTSEEEDSDERCSFSTYTVKKGDTLFSISRKTKASVDSISGSNRLNNNKIAPGMKLKIRTCGDKQQSSSAARGKQVKVKKETNPAKNFTWPLKKVNNFRKDGSDEVKSIGIYITGTPNSDVVASGDGKVEKIGYMRGYGKYIAIKHDNRFVTVYSNLMKIYVREGEKVSKGGVIGSISDDKTLHFQIGHAGKPENPLKHLPGRS